MPLKMFRSLSSLQKLDKNVVDNLNRYREGDFSDLLREQKLLTIDEELDTSFWGINLHQ